jgi:membrane protease subunit (stomatin/prohibitin family)
MMMRRRRPLLGAAMIGGTAYVAGKRNMEAQQREADEQAQIADLQAQVQSQQAPAAAAPAPAAAPAGDDIASKLTQLKGLMDQGVLSPEEFAAAKSKLLAG